AAIPRHSRSICPPPRRARPRGEWPSETAAHGMLIGALARVDRRIPEREVNEVGPVRTQPACDLERLVEVQSDRVAVILRRKAHADDESLRDGGADGSHD